MARGESAGDIAALEGGPDVSERAPAALAGQPTAAPTAASRPEPYLTGRGGG
jgi:hypothetical protein